MLIDWFTTCAQIVNFLILVWLMKRFLYGPIIRVMDEREKSIASRLREADLKKDEAEREAAAYTEKQRELDRNRDTLLGEAVEEASARREELVREAREEVDRLRSRWGEAVEREKDAFLRDLRLRVARQVCDATRCALAEIAGAELERLVLRVFARRLDALEEPVAKTLAESVGGKAGEPVVITSAFDIDEDERSHLLDVLRDRFGDGIRVDWSTDAGLLCGVELTAHGYRVPWSFDQFVQDLEQDIGALLEEVSWTRGGRQDDEKAGGGRQAGTSEEAGGGRR